MKKPDYLISTPENVDLHLELAGLGSRVWAAFVDQVLITLLVVLVVLVGTLACMLLEQSDIPRDTRSMVFFYIVGIGVFITFLIQFGYFICFEGLWQGQTPGKRLIHIRVIDSNGQPVNWASVWIRNLMRLVDQWLSMVGLLVMVIDKNERRLGDLAGGTLVIREREPEISARNLRITATDAPTTLVDTGQMKPDEYHLLVTFLRRRHDLKGPSRVSLAKQLEEYFKEKLHPEYTTETPEEFLEKLYLAYSHRAELEKM